MPTSSNLNYRPDVPNMVFATIGTGGKVCIYADGSTSVLADVAGLFRGVDDLRVAPPRADPGDPERCGLKGYTGDKPTGGQVVRLKVTGVGTSQVPAGVDAVVLNVTGTDATRQRIRHRVAV